MRFLSTTILKTGPYALTDPTRPVRYLDSPFLYMIVQSQSICCFARNQQETAH